MQSNLGMMRPTGWNERAHAPSRRTNTIPGIARASPAVRVAAAMACKAREEKKLRKAVEFPKPPHTYGQRNH